MDRLTALHALIRTVDLGSFSAAAADLGVTQSTVSKWVARLEAEVGTRLLDRTTRRLRTTAAGARLVGDGRKLLDGWQAAVDGVRDDALSGTVRLGLPAVFGAMHLVPLLPDLLAAHPRLQLDLRFDDTRVDLLAAGLDVVVRIGPVPDSTLQTRILARSSRWLVASPAYLANHGTPDEPSALARHLLLPHLGPTDRTWTLAREGTSTRVAVHSRVVCNHSRAAAALAETGQGIARLADWLVRPAVDDGRLVRVLPTWSAGTAPIRALWLPPGPAGGRRRKALVDALAVGLAARVSSGLDLDG